jgi:hypothetical protein
VSRRSLTLAYGNPVPSNICSHSSVVLLLVISSICDSNRLRFATLAELIANRSSVDHSGLPSPLQSIAKRRSFPPPNRTSPFEVLKALYGTTDAFYTTVSQGSMDAKGLYILDGVTSLRWAVPHLPVSLFPDTKTDCAIFDNVATWQSLRATSTC